MYFFNQIKHQVFLNRLYSIEDGAQMPESRIENRETLSPRDMWLVGDSLTVGMGRQLSGARVIAEVGRHVSDMPASFENAIQEAIQSGQRLPQVVTIMGGTNDGGNINLIQSNYSRMIDLARSHGIKIVLPTLPPIRGEDLTAANEYIRSLANNSDIFVVELADNEQGGDRVHFRNYSGPATELLSAAQESVAHTQVAPSNREDFFSRAEQLGIDITRIREELTGLREETQIVEQVEKAQEILTKIETLRIFERQVGGEIQALERGLSQDEADANIIFEDAEEISTMRERILNYKREYNQYVEESEALQRTLETLAQNTLSDEEQERFQTITNRDFLSLSPEERLRFVTVGNISAARVASGDIEHLEFTFTYDGVFNRDLYIRTTAGQVLPPEVREVTAGSEVFTRNGLNGEFFTQSGKRLKIHEGTRIDISQIATTEEIENIQNALQENLGEYQGTPQEDIARYALEKGIEPRFAILMYAEQIEATSGDTRRVLIEDKMTDIARFQDDFSDEHPGEESFHEGIVTERFAGYVANLISADIETLATEYDFNEETLRGMRRTERYTSGGALNMENVDIAGVSQEEINRILNLDRFTPGSREAQILFTVAAQSAGLPEEWASNPGLHYILSHESNGVVGRLNYTIPDSYTPERFRELALARRNNNPMGVRSTASGLGQLLLSNVDRYYPDGREGLGDPLNEAVGMIRYIHDRYGNIETARGLYGRTGTLNGVTKTFREGY